MTLFYAAVTAAVWLVGAFTLGVLVGARLEARSALRVIREQRSRRAGANFVGGETTEEAFALLGASPARDGRRRRAAA